MVFQYRSERFYHKRHDAYTGYLFAFMKGSLASPPRSLFSSRFWLQPLGSHVAGTLAHSNMADAMVSDATTDDILPHITVVDYGVLGTQLVPGSGIVRHAEPPNNFTAFVDPAGLPFIQRMGPSGAGGASGSIYEHIGIRDDDSFPEDVVEAIADECQAAYHLYATADGGVHHCIHAVGAVAWGNA